MPFPPPPLLDPREEVAAAAAGAAAGAGVSTARRSGGIVHSVCFGVFALECTRLNRGVHWWFFNRQTFGR